MEYPFTEYYSCNNGTVSADYIVGGGDSSTSDYEIYYTLDKTANTDSDKYMEYGVGDTVTASVYIKNNTSAAVSLQAYDLYLTYDSNLTFSSFTASTTGGSVTEKKDANNIVTHIQAIGAEGNAININLPVYDANDADTIIKLGEIKFTVNTAAVYMTDMAIALTPGSAAQGNTSTNIGVANYVDDTSTTGNKNSYYPGVTGEVDGVEINTTYEVKYDANAGNDTVTGMPNPLTEYKQHNVAYTVASAPSRTGYTFKGWSTTSGENNTVTHAAGATYSTNEKLELYAVWQSNSVTITWMNGNQQYGDTNTIDYNTVPTAPATNPSKDADAQYTYTFLGWNTDPNATTKLDTFAAATTDTTYYAIYSKTLNKYTVTFKSQDDQTTLHTVDIEYGKQPTYGGETPTKTDTAQYDYEFVGWAESTNQTSGTAIGSLPTVTGEKTYYAAFSETLRSYNVKFDAGTGSFADGATTEETVNYGSKPASIPTPTAPNGYTFTGWSDSTTTYKTDLSDFTVSGEVTLTAQYTPEEYTITLNPDGGTVDGMTAGSDGNYSVTYTIAGNQTLPSASKTGYAFNGWKLEAKTYGWEANTYGANTSVKDKWGNVTLVAQWTEDAHEVKQSTSVDNGTATPNVNSAKEGDAVTVTVTPAEGYKFDADSNTVTATYTDGNNQQQTITVTVTVTDEDGDGTYTGTFTMVDYNVEINATFTAIDYNVTVTVTPEGYATVTPSKTTANINDEITLTVSNIKDGYELSGYISENVSIADGKFTMPASNVSVTATFKGKSYEIAYNDNGGTNTMSNTTGTFGTATTLSTNAFTRVGYTFKGWADNANATTAAYTDGASFNPETYAESYTLYAVWEAADVNYTVKHWLQNLNADVSDTENGYTLAENGTETLTAKTGASVTPTVNTYTGFKAPEAQTVTVAADGSTVVNYYYTRESYTITFKDGSGDEVYKTETLQFGAAVTAPTDPTKNGYTFKEWSPEIPGTMPAEATTISATWNIVTYNITYKDGETTLSNLTPATYTIVSTDKLPTYSKTNYTFKGWKVTDGANEKWADSSEIKAETVLTGYYGDVTLTAVWEEAIKYEVQEYKYAGASQYMLLVATESNANAYTYDNQTMFYSDADGYKLSVTVDGETVQRNVFVTLISSVDVQTVNGQLRLTEAGMAKLASGTGEATTIRTSGDINNDGVVNIADANIVYQMNVYNGGYYTDLEIADRLAADMVKDSANAEHRGSIADVNAIINIINNAATN